MRLLTVLFASALLAATALPQSAKDIQVADYEKKLRDELDEAGQRHLRLGSWARDAGLVPQATAQFLRAVEVSEGNNPGAQTVLGIMRGYGDAFWKRDRKKPPKALVGEYQKRSAAIELDTRQAHLRLLRQALRAGLDDAAKKHCLMVLRLGGKLEVDKQGKHKLDGVLLPDELGPWLEQQTVAVNKTERTFEAAGEKAPKLQDLLERKNDKLIVRTDLPAASADELFALANALMPFLEDRLDGAPTRRLQLAVFSKRADYVAYLTACGCADHAIAPGLAEYGTFQTLVCADALSPPEIQALVLHELSHLYFFGVAPAAMPDWYAEGFAESFGGQGTFTWDGRKLTVGGVMPKSRLATVTAAPIPLKELVTADVHAVLVADRDKGLRFYAQSWALMRFLRQPECAWQARFDWFESQARGQVLGANPGQSHGNRMPAEQLFQKLFSADLDQLEAAFTAWLQQQ